MIILMGERHRIPGVVVSLLRKGPTPVGCYKDFITMRDYHLSEWNEVIEEVVKYGMRPSQLRLSIKIGPGKG